MVVPGALALLALTSLALAQEATELKTAHKMMSDGWKMFNDGQRLVIKGQEMNNLVAQQMGFLQDMAPGNRYIQDGRNTMTQGATLFAQGNKTLQDNQNTPSVAKQGLKMMSEGFKIAMDGMKMVEKGQSMNIKVAADKGATEKFAQGNQVISDGLNTMAQGAKLFREGQDIALKL
uniref:Uncharacterized protein n=1 Tax=Desulfobacca acetoxidans TaxID=60893 RepID=A0A7V4G9I7_9BACT